MEHYYLGLDGGTTRLKAALFDARLQKLDEESCAVEVFSPAAGYSEIDMEDYWRRACAVLRALTARNAVRMPGLAGLCIAAQGDGCWPIDDTGAPVRRAILWNDTRAKSEAFLPEALCDSAKTRHTNLVYASSVSAILLWMKHRESEAYRRIRWVLHCKDWLNFRLCGRIATDITDASTALTDILHGVYVPEQLRLLGIAECEGCFPEILEPRALLGTVLPAASETTGIPAGTPLAVGALDVCAAALGSDLIRCGTGCSIIGTTLANQMVLSRRDIETREISVVLVRHLLEDTYLNILSTLSGASSMDFARRLLCPDAGWEEISRWVRETPVGAGGVVFHPYLHGERAPFTNPFAFGAFLGLNETHTVKHLMRGVFEGIACSFYDCFRAFPYAPEALWLTGGAARNDTLCQMFADLCGRPCRRVSDNGESGILGAVRNLQVALGHAAGYTDFPCQPTDVFSPDPRAHEALRAVYGRFRRLRETLESAYGPESVNGAAPKEN